MKTNTIQVFAKWQITKNKRNEVVELLTEVAEKSRVEKGNLFYKVFQSQSDENVLLLSEAYTDEKALEEHRNSSHFQNIVVKKIVPLLESREVFITSEII